MLDSTREKIRQKYTQAEIGRYMGVAQQTVWQWFSFDVPPKQVIPLGPEAAGSLVQLIDQRVQAVMLSMRRDGGMLSG